jgi:4-hydroxybutyrate dehydrogenase/sulfolactaldehyde 3-reductase
MDKKIGFIGLGTMGAPVATRLLNCGFSLILYDIDIRKLEIFSKSSNCEIALSPKDVGKSAQRVITILPNSDIVSEVLFGDNGLIHSLSDGSVVIEMSTGSVPAFIKQAEKLAEKKLQMVDLPVGRSPAEALTGQLIAMAGIDKDHAGAVVDIAEAIAEETIYTGKLGDGLRLKLVNNYMAMIGHVLAAEVLALALKVGLNRNQTVCLLQKTAAGRGQLLTNFPKKVLANDITPDFPVSMGIKDIDMALELFSSIGQEGKFGTLTKQIFIKASNNGYSDKDCTSVLNYLDEAFDLQS